MSLKGKVAFITGAAHGQGRVTALAKEGVKVNEKTQTQEFALTAYTAIIILVPFALSSLQKMLNYVMFFDSIGLIAACSPVFILRKDQKRKEKKKVYTK